MEAGVQVWCRDLDGDEAWIRAEVISKSAKEVTCAELKNSENVFTRPAGKNGGYEGVELANVALSEEERAAGADDDLITLQHLHEPALLHAVQERFSDGKIYTWTGPVLIAVNPFKRLPLYTREILDSYRRVGLLKSQNIQTNEKLAPHIYAISDRAYRQMMYAGKFTPQSVLISGESGAGKTESTKIVMLYLTTLGSNDSGGDEEKKEDLSTMEKVLQSNPILEAFGNAKTLRNDNSSRFGKYIELGFSRKGHLLGAKVTTYLLEKVRLGFHASGERNYHIFYQIVRGASEEQQKRWGFHEGQTGGLELAAYYYYTGQGGAPQMRGSSDEGEFKFTLQSMRSMNWSEEKVEAVLDLVAGMLNLGQVTFSGVASEGDEIAGISDMKVVELAANLMGVDVDKLKCALTERKIVTRGDVITKPLTPKAAIDARDAMTKTIFGALFLWVVEQVNFCIQWENDSEVRSSIGVLDIFGFESFAINSFEQLCINFTNEALQQQFNKFIFKKEQEEYEREQIEWSFVSFPDNQDVLDLIQKNKTGILSMLDDEVRVPNGNDRNWASRMYKAYLPKNKSETEDGRFGATPVQKSKSIFVVTHFAGPVHYFAETGFLEKNKDEIPLTCAEMCETAPSELLRNVYSVQKQASEDADTAAKATPNKAPGRGRGGAGAKKTKTVGKQFKEQLISLIHNVEQTEPHYIRCLKPNDKKLPLMIQRVRLTDQLRCGGVLEAIRVARMGYPVRLSQGAFFGRYRMLLPNITADELPWTLDEEDTGEHVQKLCTQLVDKLLEEGKKQVEPKDSSLQRIRKMQPSPVAMEFPREEVQLGVSKVFMRKGPHDAMESNRMFHQSVAVIYIQTIYRGAQEYRKKLLLEAATAIVQRFYRGCVGRARWWHFRQMAAAEMLTRHFRMLLVRHRYERALKGTLRYQALYRGYALRRLRATHKIQTHYRMYVRAYAYRRLKSATIAMQCAARRNAAIHIYEALVKEQKDIGNLKEQNENLKTEMQSLKAMLAAQAQTDVQRLESEKQLVEKESQISELEKHVAQLEKHLEAEKERVEKLEKEIKTVKEESEKQIKSLKEIPHPPPSPLVTRGTPPASPSSNSHRRRKSFDGTKSPHLKPISEQQQRSISVSSAASVNGGAETTQYLGEIARLERLLEEERRKKVEDLPILPAMPDSNDAMAEILTLKEQLANVQTEKQEMEARLQAQDPPPTSENPAVLQQHVDEIAKLEEQLSVERKSKREMQAALAAASTGENGDAPTASLDSQYLQEIENLEQLLEAEKKSKRELQSSMAEAVAAATAAAKPTIDPVKHAEEIANLQEMLEAERASRKQADGEIIKLRASMSGVTLNESDVDALVAPTVKTTEEDAKDAIQQLSEENTNNVDMAPEVTGAEEEKERQQTPATPTKELSVVVEDQDDEEMKQIREESVTPEVLAALGKLGVKGANEHPIFEQQKEKPRPALLKSPSEYFPMVRRGFAPAEEETKEEEVMAVGWTVEITNRKEREEALRDEVRRFEIKMRKFYSFLEEGVEVIVWQLNRNADNQDTKDDFILKSAPIALKLQRRGEMLLQAVLTFNARGGVLSKALGRTDRSIIDPLALHEILEVKAGCAGYEISKLPTSGPAKATKGKKLNDTVQASIFLTLKASPTPVASSRLYFVKFKSRVARNDLMNGLRGLLADVQIHEGVSVSTIHTPKQQQSTTSRHLHRKNSNREMEEKEDSPEILVPLAEVHKALNRERQSYDRILLMMLQGSSDLKEKEEELLRLRGKLTELVKLSAEKDRTQANDSKLIMQLSKKLEMLLMENEDLRDQNDRVNSRLVAVECEKMNLMT